MLWGAEYTQINTLRQGETGTEECGSREGHRRRPRVATPELRLKDQRKEWARGGDRQGGTQALGWQGHGQTADRNTLQRWHLVYHRDECQGQGM